MTEIGQRHDPEAYRLDLAGEPNAGWQVDIAPFGVVRAWSAAGPIPWAREHTLPGEETPTLWREHARTATVTGSGETVWLPLPGYGSAPANLGIEWDEPRDVHSIQVQYQAGAVPAPADVDLQYWWWSWPAPEPAPGRVGWMRIDDKWFGHWTSANDEVAVRGTTHFHTFLPLSTREVSHSQGVSARFRRTRKIRLVFRAGIEVAIAGMRIFSGARWNGIDCRLDLEGAEHRDGQIQVANGYLLAIASDDVTAGARALEANCRQAAIGAPGRWHLRLLATDASAASGDETIVTVRLAGRAFSFLTRDLARGDIFVRNLGAHVVPLGEDRALRVPSVAERTIIERVLAEPEQSIARAMAEIPVLRKREHRTIGERYVPLATDSNRQEFAIQYNGNVFCDRAELLKAKPGDADRLLWPADRIAYRFGTGETPDFREREDAAAQSLLEDCLPVVRTHWRTDGISYEQEAFATLLRGELAPETTKRGDVSAVLLVRLSARNEEARPALAIVWLAVQPGEDLAVENGAIVARAALAADDPRLYDGARLRLCALQATGVFETPRAAGAPEGAIRYAPLLAPGETHEIILAIPFITLTEASEIEQVRRLDYAAKRAEVISYWRERIDAGAAIEVPESQLNSFYRAVIPHVLISTDKDVPTGLSMNPAATFRYDVFANETCIQARMLDMRGYHDLARRYLEPFLYYQGVGVLPGLFASQRGVLHNAGPYTHVGYNLNHGWLLWTLAEHYRFTRDLRWLGDVAAHLVEGCDWISQERRATMQDDGHGGRTRTFGLLPPGHLEDPVEWQHWYSVNAYAHRGLRAIADVLAEIGDPAAPRLDKEATAYREDIRASVRESIALSPAVRLHDGTYVPHVPTRADIRGRDLAWIRDVLYGPAHLIECGILAPDGPEADWILNDLEDNLFLSESHGLGPPADRWFSQGGITHQPNLLNTVLLYLLRDQIPLALRAFYNAFAASLYRDVNAFAEWLPAFGIGGGPFYKTPDEAAWVIWLRSLLVLEDRDRLWLAKGTPRSWLDHGREIHVAGAATHFGPVGFHIRSEVSHGRIGVEILPPSRNPPSEIGVRLRHPNALPIKSIRCEGARFTAGPKDGETLHVTDFAGPIRLEVTY